MGGLIKFLYKLVTLPIRIVWKLRKLLLLVGAAVGAWFGYKKRQEMETGQGTEEPV